MGGAAGVPHRFPDGGGTRVIHWYPHLLGGGGVANAVVGLVNAQRELGLEVAVACKQAYGYGTPSGLDPDIPVFRWRQRGRTFLGRIVQPGPRASGYAPLLAFAPDVVHVHGEFNPDNLAVAERFPCPVVLSPHGSFHPGVFGKRRAALKRLYFRLARRRLYRRAQFHAASPLEAAHIAALMADRTVVCAPLGPGLDLTPVAAGAPRPAGAPLRLLFVGRLDVYTKGLDLLLRALPLTAARCRQPIELHLAGGDQGGGRAALEALAHTLGVADRIRWHGQLGPAAVGELFAAGDIYVQLSRHEGFGLSAVEALCAGLPAVLSDQMGVSSFPELARQPHVSLVAPDPLAAAVALSACAERLPEMARAARERAAELREFFSWPHAARVLMARYLELAPPQSARQPVRAGLRAASA